MYRNQLSIICIFEPKIDAGNNVSRMANKKRRGNIQALIDIFGNVFPHCIQTDGRKDYSRKAPEKAKNNLESC